MLYKGKDVFNAIIADDEDGIAYISLVDMPAVERDFVCFAKEKEMIRFAVENEEKHIISGVIMMADTPIYRRNGDYEYYVTYSKETLRKMAEKMLSDGTFKNVDIMHDNQVIKGINLLEIYIKDDAKGISPNFVDNVPDGSLMGSFHVENETLWSAIKSGEFLKGFSLAGLFTLQEMNNNQIKKENKMSKITKFIKSLMKFGEVSTDKGTIYFGEDEIAVGIEVYVNGENEEEKVAAEDGEYTLEDERVIVVKDGKIDEIREKEEEKPAEEPVEETEVVVENEEEVPAEEVVVEEPAEEANPYEERIANLESKVAELEKTIADLVERLAKIETTPAVEPIVEEFQKATEVNEKGLSKSTMKAINLFKNAKRK